MKKITKKDLRGLEQLFPVLEEKEMRRFVGGNSNSYYGTDWLNHGYGSYDSNENYHWYSGYTQDEFYNWEGAWYGGWVYGMGYVLPDVYIYGIYGGPKYTLDDLFYWEGYWTGGYIEGVGYVGSDNNITTYDPGKLPKTGVELYDMMYRSGFDLGYEAGQSGNTWAAISAKAAAFFAAASAGSEFGDVDYEMIYFSRGIREGYAKGKNSREY